MAKCLESLELGHGFSFIDELVKLGAKETTFARLAVLHVTKGGKSVAKDKPSKE